MFRTLRRQVTYANVTATLALTVALGTGGAYAANEWTGVNIVDGSLTGADVQDASIGGGKLVPNAINASRLAASSVETSEIADGNVFNADLAPNSISSTRIAPNGVETSDIADGNVFNADLAPNSISSTRVADNSITGDDIDEASLAKVPVATEANLLQGHQAIDFTREANVVGARVYGGDIAGTPAQRAVGDITDMEGGNDGAPVRLFFTRDLTDCAVTAVKHASESSFRVSVQGSRVDVYGDTSFSVIGYCPPNPNSVNGRPWAAP